MALKFVILAASLAIARGGFLQREYSTPAGAALSTRLTPAVYAAAGLPLPITTSYRIDRPLIRYSQDSRPVGYLASTFSPKLSPVPAKYTPLFYSKPLVHLSTAANFAEAPVAPVAKLTTIPLLSEKVNLESPSLPLLTPSPLSPTPLATSISYLHPTIALNQRASVLSTLPVYHHKSANSSIPSYQPIADVRSIGSVTQQFDSNSQYTFSYEVEDTLTGDSKNHIETSDGYSVQGNYSLTDPDGTKRIVEYTADPVHGYNAVVRKEPLISKADIAKVRDHSLVYTQALIH